MIMTPDKTLNKYISFGMYKEQYSHLKVKAKSNGVTVVGYLRALIDNDIK